GNWTDTDLPGCAGTGLSIFRFDEPVVGADWVGHSVCGYPHRLADDGQRRTDHGTAQRLRGCAVCSAELPATTLVCRHCHTLVHARELAQLASSAKMLEEARHF